MWEGGEGEVERCFGAAGSYCERLVRRVVCAVQQSASPGLAVCKQGAQFQTPRHDKDGWTLDNPQHFRVCFSGWVRRVGVYPPRCPGS